jgi:hypothetical protein
MTDTLIVECSGCGDQIEILDPKFQQWWQDHGRCLRQKYVDPPDEINHRLRELLRREEVKEPE